MIWRPARPEDGPAVLRLSRAPMPGRIQLVWGLAALQPPEGCRDLRAYVLDDQGGISGTALSWDWPGGGRYLAGLRFCADMDTRPARALWTEGYRQVLTGRDHAWTSIGVDNHRARRLLLGGRPWLPVYQPRQELRSWYVPLPARQRRRTSPARAATGWVPARHRYVAVAGGRGAGFALARWAHGLGLPGLPRAGQPMRIAHLEVSWEEPPDESVARLLAAVRGARGLDGLVLTLPSGSPLAEAWARRAPVYASVWDSTLYSVTWQPDAPWPAVPAWKGAWL